MLILIPQNSDTNNPSSWVLLPLIFFGLVHSFYTSSLWPSIPYVAPKEFLGTAYGVTVSLQNIGLSLGPLIVAAIINSQKEGGNYRALNAVQLLEMLIAAGIAAWLWIYDLGPGKGLLTANSTEAARMYIRSGCYHGVEKKKRRRRRDGNSRKRLRYHHQHRGMIQIVASESAALIERGETRIQLWCFRGVRLELAADCDSGPGDIEGVRDEGEGVPEVDTPLEDAEEEHGRPVVHAAAQDVDQHHACDEAPRETQSFEVGPRYFQHLYRLGEEYHSIAHIAFGSSTRPGE